MEVHAEELEQLRYSLVRIQRQIFVPQHSEQYNIKLSVFFINYLNIFDDIYTWNDAGEERPFWRQRRSPTPYRHTTTKADRNRAGRDTSLYASSIAKLL